MPTPFIISPSFPPHDRVVTWPHPPLVGLFPSFTVPATPSNHRDSNPAFQDVANRSALGYASRIAGGGSHRIAATGSAAPLGRISGVINNNAGGVHSYQWEGLNCTVIQDATPLAAGMSLPSIDRVYRLRLFLQSVDPVLQTTHRMLLVPFNGAVAGTNSPSQAVLVNGTNRGGFGITGDGAGQWRYASYDRSGVELLYESVPLPAHDIQQINVFEWVRINARPGSETEWVFRWNGEDVISRNYASGLLTELIPLAWNEWAYTPMIEMIGATAGFIYYSMECTWGRFLPNGVEVQG